MDGWILVIDLELKTSNRDLDEANKRSISKHAAAVMFTFTIIIVFDPTALCNLDMDNTRPRRHHQTCSPVH